MAAARISTKDHRTGFRQGGRQYKQVTLSAADGSKMDAREVSKAIRAYAAKRPDLEFLVTLQAEGLGYRSLNTYISDADMPDDWGIELSLGAYDMLEADDDAGGRLPPTASIILTARKKVGTMGGDSDSNDCLGNCISEFYSGQTPKVGIKLGMKFGVSRDAHFGNEKAYKALLGVKLGEKVPAERVPILEQYLKGMRIELECVEHPALNYISPKDAPRTMRLRLKNEHYELLSGLGRRSRVKAQSSSACIYDSQTKDAVDEHGQPLQLTQAEISTMQRRPRGAPRTLLFAKHWRTYSPETGTWSTSLAEAMTDFQELRAALFKRCYLDIAKYRGDIKAFALDLFRLRSKGVRKAPACTMLEEEAILGPYQSSGKPHQLGALRGGLMISPPVPHEISVEAFSVDFCSFYPSLLKKAFLLPNSVGVPTVLNQVPESPGLGFYRCTIEAPATLTFGMRRLLSWAKPGIRWYTHMDIYTARSVGGLVQIAPGNQDTPNAIIYAREGAVRACDAFNGYIDCISVLKFGVNVPDNVRRRAKKLLNILWGALIERDRRTITYDDTREWVDIPEGYEIRGFKRSAAGPKVCITRTDGGRFANNSCGNLFPRWGAFITAQGRALMVKTLLPHANAVMRVHTDGACLLATVRDKFQDQPKHMGNLVVENDVAIYRFNGMSKPQRV